MFGGWRAFIRGGGDKSESPSRGLAWLRLGFRVPGWVWCILLLVIVGRAAASVTHTADINNPHNTPDNQRSEGLSVMHKFWEHDACQASRDPAASRPCIVREWGWVCQVSLSLIEGSCRGSMVM